MEGKKKAGEFQKQGAHLQTLGPSTRSLVQENTAVKYCNYVLLSARFKKLNKGICFNAPTPVVGNGRKGILNIEKLEYCQLTGTTGNPILDLDSAMLWSCAEADLEAMRKATLEAMEGKKKAGEFQKQGPSTLSLVLDICWNGILTPFDYEKSYEESRLEHYQLTGNSYMVVALALDFVRARIKADLEAKRKVTSKAMKDAPKDKSGNEVAPDGATAAQSHEEGELRSLSLELYEDSPVSTSAQADNNEIVEKTRFERHDSLFQHVLNAGKVIGGCVVLYYLNQNASQMKNLNEKTNAVACQVNRATIKAKKKEDKVTYQLKAVEKKMDDVAKEMKEAGEKAGNKLDELLKSTNEANKNIIRSSPYNSFSLRLGFFYRETGTSEGQGYNKAG